MKPNTKASYSKGSVSRLIEAAKSGDQPSFEALFKRFFNLLQNWASRELNAEKCRSFDAEDIAIQVCESFSQGLEKGEYKRIENRHELLGLLSTITIRKAINEIEKQNAQKRGGGRVRGESVFNDFSSSKNQDRGWDKLRSHDLSPDEISILEDEFRYHINLLPNNLQPIAIRLMMGSTPKEIAGELGYSKRSIELKRNQIREILKKTQDS